jgi:hypothetical protein
MGFLFLVPYHKSLLVFIDRTVCPQILQRALLNHLITKVILSDWSQPRKDDMSLS